MTPRSMVVEWGNETEKKKKAINRCIILWIKLTLWATDVESCWGNLRHCIGDTPRSDPTEKQQSTSDIVWDFFFWGGGGGEGGSRGEGEVVACIRTDRARSIDHSKHLIKEILSVRNCGRVHKNSKYQGTMVGHVVGLSYYNPTLAPLRFSYTPHEGRCVLSLIHNLFYKITLGMLVE